MNQFVKTILALTICLFSYAQVSAQCSNIDNRNRVRADNHIFSGMSFGQSIVIDTNCYPGSQFSQFSFWAQGNSPFKFDLKIYAGQKATGTPRYTQTDISFPPTNFGGKLTVDLKGGIGDLSFEPGQTYTFIMTGKGGNLIAHVSNNATPGQVYMKTGFDSSKDLLFEVGVSNAPRPLKLFTGNLYLNEHLKFVKKEQLTANDVWEFIEVENGNVVMKCPTRGYLVAGAYNNNIHNLGYHQFEKTATRFIVEPGHRGSGEGYKSYRWNTKNSTYANRCIGNWRNTLVIRGGLGDATSFRFD